MLLHRFLGNDTVTIKLLLWVGLLSSSEAARVLETSEQTCYSSALACFWRAGSAWEFI